jgi:hypothetical protein
MAANGVIIRFDLKIILTPGRSGTLTLQKNRRTPLLLAREKKGTSHFSSPTDAFAELALPPGPSPPKFRIVFVNTTCKLSNIVREHPQVLQIRRTPPPVGEASPS